MKIPEMNYKIMFSKLEKLNLFIIYDQNNGSLFRTITKTLQMKMKNNLKKKEKHEILHKIVQFPKNSTNVEIQNNCSIDV